MVAAAFTGDFAIKVFLVFEYGNDLDHGGRVVACINDVFGAEAVGFEFVFAAKSTEAALRPYRGDIAYLRADVAAAGSDCGDYAADSRRRFCEPTARLLLHSMPRSDVRDFVCEYGGEFGLRIHKSEQPTVNVNVTGRQREGVDFGVVDYRKRIR